MKNFGSEDMEYLRCVSVPEGMTANQFMAKIIDKELYNCDIYYGIKKELIDIFYDYYWKKDPNPKANALYSFNSSFTTESIVKHHLKDGGNPADLIGLVIKGLEEQGDEFFKHQLFQPRVEDYQVKIPEGDNE